MNWTKDKSLVLSRVSVILFFAALVAVCIFAPKLLGWRLGYHAYLMPFYLASIYCSAPFAAAVLWQLHRLLRNIGRGEVFVQTNVRCLRAISWCCIGAAAVLFASGFYDFLFFALSAMAAFVGLILRVVKNVIAEAVAIKAENDFTI
ncbi:DUF2975 domain-containing protein [Agathobaculum sp. NTUH-O15-33]|uniref:DUF2975 domain-containing protein n=1 Tax=Agathobaculum sp. NTUH-O15-33 TaxID=3079302 RepID=UPI002958D7BE|nr:DUF2975 domain-containing protein [Agathobaculum sp. NTUH-O15-33]WNX86425.1 DUF2975 domain-containing protein [Agathobaculum sp. NTUH-O15-33]